MKDNKKQLALEIKNRLKYLTFVAPDEEFNATEIKLLVSLLEIYEPSEYNEQDTKAQLDKIWKKIEEKTQQKEKPE